MCAEGTSGVQFIKISEKNIKLIKALGSLALNKYETEMAFKKIWTPSITYVLSNGPLLHKELQTIQVQGKMFFLPRMGWTVTTPSAVVHG
jgi:hypothetical protein